MIVVLQDQGFVERFPDPGDSRRMIVRATPWGMDWVTDTRALWNGRLATVIAAEFTATEQRRLAAAIPPLLERLRDAL